MSTAFFRTVFLIVISVLSFQAQARLTDASEQKLGLKDREILDLFRGPNGREVKLHEKDIKLRKHLDRILTGMPGSEKLRKSLREQYETGHKPMRIQLAEAGGQVQWTVWWRDTGKEVYSLQTTPEMAEYFRQGLLGRPDACQFGCSITPILGGSR